MRSKKKNSSDDAVAALKAALRIIESNNLQKADAGACVWTKPDGTFICVRLTPEDCAKIPGMLFIGGPCKEVETQIAKRSS